MKIRDSLKQIAEDTPNVDSANWHSLIGFPLPELEMEIFRSRIPKIPAHTRLGGNLPVPHSTQAQSELQAVSVPWGAGSM